jgi:hypothetical protein
MDDRHQELVRMSAHRILNVTLILAAMGVIVGAVLGAALGLAVGIVRNGMPVFDAAAGVMLMSALAGAGLGAVLAPLTAWLLLRHVPIGRAMGFTALGTAAGAGVGLFLRDVWWLAMALLGFVLTAIWLRLTTKVSPAVPDAGPSAE